MKQLLPVAIGLVLSLGVAAAQAQPASPQQYPTYGYGMGPGMMGGYPMGPGMMGPGMMGPGMMGSGMMGPGGMMGRYGAQGGARMCGMMNYQMGGRLAYLKTELQITKAQEGAWTAYADAVQNSSQSMVAHCNTMMGGNSWNTLSPPDRLERHEQFMATQLDAMRAVNKTLKPLYAALNDSQKKAADQLIWFPMGMM